MIERKCCSHGRCHYCDQPLRDCACDAHAVMPSGVVIHCDEDGREDDDA